MNGRSSGQLIAIGGDPKIDLLPPDLRSKRKARKLLGRYGLGLVLLALTIFTGTVLARAQAMDALTNLRLEQRLTQTILVQQRQYSSVQKIQTKIELIQAGQQVGISTEINWEKFLKAVQVTLPPNVTINTVNIDSETPFSSYSQPNGPLQGERIATLNFTATSSTLPRIPDWLKSLATLSGYADATPGMVTRNESGSYSVDINMHINEKAFTNRYSSLGRKL